MYNPRKNYPINKIQFEILMTEIDEEFKQMGIPIENREINVGFLLNRWLGYNGKFSPDMNLVNNDVFTGDSLRAKTINWYDKMYGNKQLINNDIAKIPIRLNNNYYEFNIPKIFGNINYFMDKNLSCHESINSCNLLKCISNITEIYLDKLSVDDLKKFQIFSIKAIQAFNWLYKIDNHKLFSISLSDYNSSSYNLFNNNIEQSIWASQQALEKIIKAFLCIGKYTYPKNNKGHDLIALIELLNKNLNLNIDHNIISSANHSPSVRYGEVETNFNMGFQANLNFVNFIIIMNNNEQVNEYIKNHKI